jgi:membrane protease YdiL (CAAX protease family)
MQFMVLIAICIGIMILGTLVGAVIVIALYGLNILGQIASFSGSDPHVVTSIWILQITSTTIPLFIAPVVFARYIVNQPQTYLKPNINIPIALFALVLAIMFVSMPLMEFLISVNQKMTLPDALKDLEQWLRDKEKQAQDETQLLLQMKTLGSMLFALLEIGLLTAIAEEFLFRGCVQSIFTRWTQSHHWGIWIAAAIFSAFHMQFFGFLPRMMLGVGFGYFVYYSGSIWTSVLAHFLNNGTAVILTYLFQQKIIAFDPDSNHYNYIITTISLIFTVLLFFIYQKVALSKKQLQVNNGKGLG